MGVCSTCYESGDTSTIVTLEVAMPLTVVLDSDAIVLNQAVALEFDPDFGCSDSHYRHTQCGCCQCTRVRY
jgi:hypothetical protein